jgi:uncharacterized protein (TIGR03435 family)
MSTVQAGMPMCSAVRVPVFAGLALLGLSAPGVRGQSAGTARPEFEVASIKPHPPSEGPPGISMIIEHGRLTFTAVTVRACIRKAYGLKIYPPSRGPDALSTDRYDIVAKAPGDATEEQTVLMLRALLEERFKLAVHRETRELPIYALVVGKNGPKFREAPADGTETQIDSGGGHQIRAHHASMKLLASALSEHIDPVVDATGLTGLFDFNLDFTLDESLSATGISLFEAVQQQLGLKLEARKGPVEVVVIDHVEKPSAN